MGGLLQDVRYGIRVLIKTPIVTLVAVLTLAVGIGATAAIFIFIDAGLIRAVPYSDANRLVRVTMVKGGEASESEASYPTFLDWRAQNRSFEALGGYAPGGDILWTGLGTPQPVKSAYVSANFFSILGVRSVAGRLFNDSDEQAHENSPTVVSYAFWQNHFGGRTETIGQVVTLGNVRYTIVGILPRSFEFPPLGSVDMYILPPSNGPRFTRRGMNWIFGVGKLKRGNSIEEARSDMQVVSERLAKLYPSTNEGTRTRIISLREAIVGPVRPVLLLLFAAAGFVLLLGCANVANVLLARTAARRQEMAIRFALGARRGRLIRRF